MRTLGQVNQVLLLLMPILQQMPTAASVAVKSGEALSNPPSKQQENVTPSAAASSAAARAEPKPPGGVEEAASVETAPDDIDEDPIDRGDSKRPAKPLDLKPTKSGTSSRKSGGGRGGGGGGGGRRPNPAVESAKSALIREFVASHGDRIRKSRKHADLFDGSGYLIDMMKELHQYESRAEDETVRGRHHSRHKRSTAAADGGDIKDPDLPNFASLSDALAHLNGGRQEETISADFNVRFVDDDDDDDSNEEQQLQAEGVDELASESKRPRRRKRSLGDPDDDGDDPDWWLSGGDGNLRDGAEDAQEESRRQREAAESMERLDADLQELAKYLDEQAAEERLQAQEEQTRDPVAKFNRGMTAAYKNLVKLRGMAQDALSGSAEPHQRQQQPRMRDLYPGKTANWHIDAEVLEATLRDLNKYYRRIDEL